MEAALVRGMMYVTMVYAGLTPRLDLGKLSVLNVTAWDASGRITFPEQVPVPGTKLTGSKIELKFAQTDSTYHLYTEQA